MVLLAEFGQRQPDSRPDQSHPVYSPLYRYRIRLCEQRGVQWLQAVVDRFCRLTLSRACQPAEFGHLPPHHVTAYRDDAVPTLLARTEREREGRCVLGDPRHREDAAADEHDDGGRPGGDDCLDQRLLRPREPEIGRVAELAAANPATSAIRKRIENLGIDRWSVWRSAGERSVTELDIASRRCVIVDTGSLAGPDERAALSMAILCNRWKMRGARRPAA